MTFANIKNPFEPFSILTVTDSKLSNNIAADTQKKHASMLTCVRLLHELGSEPVRLLLAKSSETSCSKFKGNHQMD